MKKERTVARNVKALESSTGWASLVEAAKEWRTAEKRHALMVLGERKKCGCENTPEKHCVHYQLKGQSELASVSCCAAVWKEDTWRYTGRGKSGFEMHYNRKRCTRKATHGLFCWQHQHGHHPYYEPQHNADIRRSGSTSEPTNKNEL